MRIANDSLIDSNVDLIPGWTSEGVWLGHISQFAVQFTVSGTFTGTFKVQVSCDNPKMTNGTLTTTEISNWSDLSGATIAVSNTGTYFLNLVDAGYNFFRIVYTNSSGVAGTLTSARFNAKGI